MSYGLNGTCFVDSCEEKAVRIVNKFPYCEPHAKSWEDYLRVQPN